MTDFLYTDPHYLNYLVNTHDTPDIFIIIFVATIWIFLSIIVGIGAQRRGKILGKYLILSLLLSPLVGVLTLFLLYVSGEENAASEKIPDIPPTATEGEPDTASPQWEKRNGSHIFLSENIERIRFFPQQEAFGSEPSRTEACLYNDSLDDYRISSMEIYGICDGRFLLKEGDVIPHGKFMLIEYDKPIHQYDNHNILLVLEKA